MCVTSLFGAECCGFEIVVEIRLGTAHSKVQEVNPPIIKSVRVVWIEGRAGQVAGLFRAIAGAGRVVIKVLVVIAVCNVCFWQGGV